MRRNHYRRRKNTKQQGGAIRHVIGLFASFLCGYLVASVFGLSGFISWVNMQWTHYQNQVEHTQAQNQTTEAVKKAEVAKPRFEFYTLLSKEPNAAATAAATSAAREPGAPTQLASKEGGSTVQSEVRTSAVEIPEGKSEHLNGLSTSSVSSSKSEVPVVDSQASVAVRNSPEVKTPSREAYMIQVAAVTRRQDAERLKASLVLKGYSVMVISSVQAKNNWFRVVIGPFHSRAEAEKAQLNVARTEHIQGMIRKIDV